MPKATYPPPSGIAIGDVWQNHHNTEDSAIVISLDWDLYDYDRWGWVATFQWLSGERNKYHVNRFLDVTQNQTYRRVAWLDATT